MGQKIDRVQGGDGDSWGQSVDPASPPPKGRPPSDQRALGAGGQGEAWLLLSKPEHWVCSRDGWSHGAGPVQRPDCLAGET